MKLAGMGYTQKPLFMDSLTGSISIV